MYETFGIFTPTMVAIKELATKTDIKEIELKMSEVKSELIRWVVAAGFLQTVLIAALLMKLIK
jgi:hypothetical protein